MLRIDEVRAAKFAMARCPRCGLLVTATEKNGHYRLPKDEKKNCHAISVHRDKDGSVVICFPQE